MQGAAQPTEPEPEHSSIKDTAARSICCLLIEAHTNIPSQPCPQADCLVAAGLRSRVLTTSDDRYKTRIESYWCNSAKLNPACIVQPTSASEVSAAVKALVEHEQVFAVRSGGHTNWARSNNIDGGVTIDLGLMNSTTYDAATETADIGPAAKWKHVYEELEQYGRAVAGGREAEVGAGGFLLGGGNNFFAGLHGLAFTAHAGGEHADLFRVHKGSGNNFGIVTRFTMRTMQSGLVWGGFAVRPMEVMPELQMPSPPLLPIRTWIPTARSTSRWATCPVWAAALCNIWYTLCFKNDASIIVKANDLHTELASQVQEKVADGDFTTHCSFQPIPRTIAQHSVAAGGNVLGLEQYAHDAIMIQVNVSMRTQELADWARPLVRGVVDGVRAFAASIDDGVCPWLHLNYASPDQKVLESYGTANMLRMREAAAKYDPRGVFQRLCPGGFKLAAVKG
ncbi:Uu.00g058050.m01.CDS01 [Anthostomella pinea]|uniref:Uu.00g058050.m01.CDS01 n=1 Tax=Anthostomella pinea TaxID=933095 RepID=A0AAI8YMC6_9PEZI|nr:Uu.00g058050.m01.CDS01 [Anthostomella pinea]